MHPRTILGGTLIAALAAGFAAARFAPVHAQDEAITLESAFVHLGDDVLEPGEWPEASREPAGNSLERRFTTRALTTEATLAISHRHVNNRWSLRLNGTELGTLRTGDDLVSRHYAVPAGLIVEGENVFEVDCDVTTDDITIGEITLYLQPLRKVLQLRPVTVTVTDRATGRKMPARITVAGVTTEPPEIYFGEGLHRAIRPGIIYTDDGEAEFELPAGKYTVYATRGFEWSLGQADLALGTRDTGRVKLTLEQEVDTTGWVAADTHIHTLTYSGHGDSSIHERMVTLAGEGVELAISTDHNHHTDYRPFQEEMGLNTYFTPVIGNEVTTSIGHFNAFPFTPDSALPDHSLTDWVALVDEIRAKGAGFVILNHPRWPGIETGPFGELDLDTVSGERHIAATFTFDAMELVNSTDPHEDALLLYRDWFALLNHGERITAVGSSDSHTVGDPVGQGRTYVQSSTDDASALDVGELVTAFAEGRTSVSQGIYAHVLVNGKFGAGDLAPVKASRVDVRIRIAAPSWVEPQRLQVYANGILTAEKQLEPMPGRAYDREHLIGVDAPPQDAWLVCVVTGAPVKEPYWRTMNPYTLASTNPVYLDQNDDGRYDSPRDSARALIERVGSDSDRLLSALRRFDSAVAVQAASLAREAYFAEARARLRKLTSGDSPHHQVLMDYLKGLPEHAED